MYALKFTGEFHCGILEDHDIEISTCGSILASVSTMKIKSKFSFLFFSGISHGYNLLFQAGILPNKIFLYFLLCFPRTR